MVARTSVILDRLRQELDGYWQHSYDPLIPSFSSMYYKDIINLGFPYSSWLENQGNTASDFG